MIDKNTRETFQFGAKKEDMRKKWMDAMKMAQLVTLYCENNKFCLSEVIIELQVTQ